ncbi:MAG: amidohydrolase family protein [Isosphaeraceae bacterium]
MRSTRLTLAARWILPVEGMPVADGLLTLDGGRIAAVEPRGGRSPDVDLGNVAILPGFINTHTHLELSPLSPPPGATQAGHEDQVEWLRRVIAQRRQGNRSDLEAAAARHTRASIEAGTTLIADTTTAGLSWSALAEAPIRSVVFAEVIGLRRERGLQTSDEAWTWLSTVGPEDQVAACARPGLSPHAPYSTSGWLYHRAAGSHLPLSTHLAELPEEIELLRDRSGRLRGFLEEIGAWDDDWDPIGPSPADYIRRGELRNADWIVAHGTYLVPSEFWQLRPEAAPGQHRVAVAFCPRTHARFGHAPHPYRAMLEKGVVVCLGTDSLASSPSLSVLDEVRFLHRSDPSLGGPLLLTMATLFGAWALRAETTTGSLKPGKSADLAIVGLPDRDAADPHTLILDSDTPVVATMFEGDFVSGPWLGR